MLFERVHQLTNYEQLLNGSVLNKLWLRSISAHTRSYLGWLQSFRKLLWKLKVHAHGKLNINIGVK